MATTSNGKSKSSQVSVVVWEWMTEVRRWRPYEPELVQYIEQHYGKTSQIYPGAVHPPLSMYIIDFSRMCQIRQGTGTARPIRRNICQIISDSGNQIVWQFAGDIAGNWDMYDFEVGNFLENSYNVGQLVIDMSTSPLHLPYYINLNKMEQVRIETGTVRSIRRQTLQTSYPSAVSQAIQPGFLQSATQNVSSTSFTNRQKRQASSSSSSDSDDLMASKPTKSKTKKTKSSAKQMKSGYSNQITSFTSGLASQVSGLSAIGPFSQSSNTSSNFTANQLSSPVQNASQSIPSSSTFLQRPLTRSMHNNYASGTLQQALPFVQNSQNNFLQQNTFVNSNATPTMPIQQNMVSNAQMSHNMLQSLMPMAQNLQNSVSSLLNPVFNSQNSLPLPITFPSLPGGLHVPNQYMPPAQQPALSNMSSVGKGRSRRTKPVVSNIANVLVSPNVPVGLSTPQVPIFSPPGLSSSSFQPLEGLPQKGRIVLSKPRKTKSKTADEVLKKYVQNVPHPKEDEDCCICYDKLQEESSYGNVHSHNERVVHFKRCNHTFHRQCLYAMYDSGHKDDSIQCPSCKTIYGERYGNCPPGEMEFHIILHSLPGYPDNHAIRVSYNIRPGVQGPEHPNPGCRYNARGFPRIGYLPDSDQGRKVLQLLIMAWKRRLMFTIGTSTTTGECDTVTWNEIHHKTEFGSNVTGHGFPDPSYLDNVMSELSVHGVTEDDL